MKTLKKLQEDLKEVIRLTQELMGEDETTKECSWKIGDMCMARCTRDKLFYKATILEILANDSCVVNFSDYDTTDICQIAYLKPVDSNTAPVQMTKKETKSRKIEKKLKKQKLLERQAEIEKAVEAEKNQWLNFSKRYNIKNKLRRSIFASPETVQGKVGVGTCGISGRPMAKSPSYHRLMRK